MQTSSSSWTRPDSLEIEDLLNPTDPRDNPANMIKHPPARAPITNNSKSHYCTPSSRPRSGPVFSEEAGGRRVVAEIIPTNPPTRCEESETVTTHSSIRISFANHRGFAAASFVACTRTPRSQPQSSRGRAVCCHVLICIWESCITAIIRFDERKRHTLVGTVPHRATRQQQAGGGFKFVALVTWQANES